MLTIEPLGLLHNRTSFDCGVDALNSFLQKTARQHKEKGLSNTFVLVNKELPATILGFFTLSFLEIDSNSLPARHARALPNNSRLPAAKLARLAVDAQYQGKGYGALLLANAIQRVAGTVSISGALTGFFVDAKDEHAKRFYQHFGFIALRDESLKLFLPLKTLLEATVKANTLHTESENRNSGFGSS